MREKKKQLTPEELTVENFENVLAAYQPLIRKSVGKLMYTYRKTYKFEFDELENVCMITLWQSLKKYDSSLGVYFGVYLRVALWNGLLCYGRDNTPHRYVRDEEKSALTGKPEFKRIIVSVASLEQEFLS